MKSFLNLFISFIFFFVVNVWGETPDIGNTCATGTEVNTTSTTASLSTNTTDDMDFFKIVIIQQGTLAVKSTSASKDVVGRLYDNTCTQITSDTGNNNFSISRTLAPGTYYVSVEDKGKNNAGVTYSFTSAFSLTEGVRSFSKREIGGQSSTNIRGNLLMIGNQLLCENSADGAACTEPTVGATNNSITQHFANVDTTTTTTAIVNSSMARLDMQTGDTILWARLYWSARMINPTATAKTNAQTIKFRTPASSAYQTISAESFDYFPLDDPYDYGASADVTSLVKAAGSGQYYGANIQADTGTNKFGSWMLLVVVQNNNRPFNNLSVYDGFQVVFDDDPSYPSQVSVVASGFLTPKSGTVTSNLLVYTGESESGIYDGATITNALGVPTDLVDAYNTSNDVFNGSASNNGIHRSASRLSDPGLANPNFQNLIGTDLDKLSVTNLNNQQTQTTITVKSTGGSDSDRYSLNMFAFETKLYEPRFCYDYGYEQNGVPFTEENIGSKKPYITGVLPNTSDINVSIYIRNLENADVNATNIKLNITDINASEAIYKRNSVALTYPNTFVPVAISDTSLSVSDTYIEDIALGTMGGSQYAYTYYGLTPQSAGDINMSINGTFAYDLVMRLPDGTTLTLPYSSTLGGAGLSMCSGDNFSYTPEWGIFSVVNSNLYDSSSANRYYDLTTQVVKRPGNFRIASFEPVNLDTPKAVTTIVAVEMIDASQFHDVDAACKEPSSAITPRVWMGFENNVSQIDFNAATIQNAIDTGMVSDVITGQPSLITLASDFFKTASPNAAFRVTFNTLADQNDSLIHIEQTAQGVRIDNFSNIHQVYPHCKQFVTNPNNNNTTNVTSVACSDNGNNSTYKDVAICMECLYGARTQVLCSRDNFAIRPESYTIKLKDNTLDIAPKHTGVLTSDLNTSQVNMAAGYTYGYDINATSHMDNSNTPGYTRYFGSSNNDYNLSLVWSPSVAKIGCNDTNSSAQSFNMYNGTAAGESVQNQVGEYKLNIIDKKWTAVDWDSAFQTHQVGTHFLSGGECLQNSTYVPAQATAVGLSGTTLSNLVGCDISSTHDNIENGLKYRDIDLSFRPDHFDVSSIGMSTGTRFNVSSINQNVWMYMNDVAVDENMSVRYFGKIRPLGENNSTLSNFVRDCYAQPVNFDLNLTFPVTAGLPSWRYRLQEVNASTPSIWNDTNAIIAAPVSANSFHLITIPQTNFLKNQNGLLDMNLSLNFDRNQTLPVNPITVGLNNLQVKCQADANCSSNAYMKSNHLPDANVTIDSNVTFVYGRLLTKDIRVFGNIAFTANGWYEVFNLPTFGGVPLQPSKDGVSWFINNMHDDDIAGDANVTRLISSTAANTVNYGGLDDNAGTDIFPFAAIAPTYNGKAHVDTAPWLWYAPNALTYSDPSAANPANFATSDAACLTHPCFNVTVMPAFGATGSAKSTNEGTKSSKSSGGTGWRSTSDYSPAAR